MPKYIFTCKQCGSSRKVYVSSRSNIIVCKECGCDMTAEMPNVNKPNNYTTKDKYTNIKVIEENQEAIKERHDRYYWQHEVPRLVASGTYSEETMLEQGWIYKDDFGAIHINTKPPSLR